MSEIISLISQSVIGLLHLILFPGGIFAICFGLFIKGCDRIVEARFQRRVGPPVLQPFYDIMKLCSKETLIPTTANENIFLLAPIIGFVGTAVCVSLLPVPGVYNGMANMGDMLVFFYLLALPAVSLMVAGSSSTSPYGALGFSREMTIMFAYELPLLITILSVAMVAGGGNGAEFSLGNVVAYQEVHGSFVFNPILFPAFIAYLIYLPGAIGTPPFDVAEAETELLEGPLLEYSGPPLAFFQVTSALKTVAVIGLGVVMFFPGTLGDSVILNLLWFMVKSLILYLVAITFVKSATGRFRIEQALMFYLKVPAPLALLSLVLAWFAS